MPLGNFIGSIIFGRCICLEPSFRVVGVVGAALRDMWTYLAIYGTSFFVVGAIFVQYFQIFFVAGTVL